MDRVTAEKMFYDLYSRSLGYGLSLARLYARYFNGDYKVAAYEGFGTDVHIYTKALSSTAVSRLPVYNTESVECWAWTGTGLTGPAA